MISVLNGVAIGIIVIIGIYMVFRYSWHMRLYDALVAAHGTGHARRFMLWLTLFAIVMGFIRWILFRH